MTDTQKSLRMHDMGCSPSGSCRPRHDRAGTQKLLGWFGGGGLTATAGGFEAMGFNQGCSSRRSRAVARSSGGCCALGMLGWSVRRWCRCHWWPSRSTSRPVLRPHNGRRTPVSTPRQHSVSAFRLRTLRPRLGGPHAGAAAARDRDRRTGRDDRRSGRNAGDSLKGCQVSPRCRSSSACQYKALTMPGDDHLGNPLFLEEQFHRRQRLRFAMYAEGTAHRTAEFADPPSQLVAPGVRRVAFDRDHLGVDDDILAEDPHLLRPFLDPTPQGVFLPGNRPAGCSSSGHRHD